MLGQERGTPLKSERTDTVQPDSATNTEAGLTPDVLLTAEHSVLCVVLRMEDYALLAGTTALFVALAGVMYFTRNVDWFAQESGKTSSA